ncbi:MAG: hypothetical protein GY720_20430 [bacterium]|nr:hypothetical protein [bacterium]
MTSFLEGLLRQGAFQGSRSEEAFLVNCDRTTTTEADRQNGVVNVSAGVAPLRPAEFVVIKLVMRAQPT